MVWPPASALLHKDTNDNYPAAKALLQSVYEGLQLPMDAALRVESRYFANILKGQVAHAMIRTLFVSMQALNKGARRPPNEPATSIKRIGVIGAGFMGSGIATVAALADVKAPKTCKVTIAFNNFDFQRDTTRVPSTIGFLSIALSTSAKSAPPEKYLRGIVS